MRIRSKIDDCLWSLIGELQCLWKQKAPVEEKLVLGEDSSIFNMPHLRIMWHV